MTLEVSPDGKRLRFTECPICGHPFTGREKRANHIARHDPEDVGLSPLGDRGAA